MASSFAPRLSPPAVSAEDYRQLLVRLALSHSQAARLFQVTVRTSGNWAAKGIEASPAAALALLIAATGDGGTPCPPINEAVARAKLFR